MKVTHPLTQRIVEVSRRQFRTLRLSGWVEADPDAVVPDPPCFGCGDTTDDSGPEDITPTYIVGAHGAEMLDPDSFES